MNLIQVVKMYITKMTDDCGPGMKMLLMDKETVSNSRVIWNCQFWLYPVKFVGIINIILINFVPDKHNKHGLFPI